MNTEIIVADFTNPCEHLKVFEEIEQLKIDVGVLVNNVGILGPHEMPFLELDQKTVIDTINVNILAATTLCHSLLPKMKEKRKGAVINISSMGSHFFVPYLAVYVPTKHYISAFTMSIAAVYAEYGITIQCIEPGVVKTAMTQFFEPKKVKGNFVRYVFFYIFAYARYNVYITTDLFSCRIGDLLSQRQRST